MNIHASQNFISLEQFYNDIGFLYYALKQALVSRGGDLIIQQERNTDEIVVYHNLIQKYRYGGGMEIYKTKLSKVIYNGYCTGYPGGALNTLMNGKMQ